MVRVRAAAAEDLSRMVEIAGRSATAAQWSRAEYQRLFAPEKEQSRDALVVERDALVVEEDGQVAGFLVAKHLDEEWEIENIAVQGQARRRGLGTRLLGEFLKMAQGRGGRRVYLEVRESNLAARALYGKWAFTEAGRRKRYYEDPPEDALLFEYIFP